MENVSHFANTQDASTECTTDDAGKVKQHPDNPFIEPVQTQTVVDMKGTCLSVCMSVCDEMYGRLPIRLASKARPAIIIIGRYSTTLIFVADVMVLNDIIEQAAGRHSRASDRGGTP